MPGFAEGLIWSEQTLKNKNDKVNTLEKIEGDEEFKEITGLTHLVPLIENFDIPYLEYTPEVMYEIAKEESNQLLIKKEIYSVGEILEGE